MRVQYPQGSVWFLRLIYASLNENNKHLLWEYMEVISQNMNEP